MTVLSRVNFTSQQRLDLTHVLASDSFAANDFRGLTAFFTGIANAYIVSGLEPNGLSGLTVTIKVSDCVIFNPMDSSGAFYFGLPDDPDINVVLPDNTPSVYIQARFSTQTQAQVNQAYWNPLAINGDSVAGNEYTASTDSQVVTVLEISNNSIGFTEGYIPIMKCSTSSASVGSIVDCRPLLFRLGTGGAVPDPYHAFPWSASRGESAYSSGIVGENTGSSFQSTDGATIKNDKGIATMKQWMDAVMTRLSEIAGTPLWYDDSVERTYVDNLNLSTVFFDSEAGHSINPSAVTTLIWNKNFTLGSEGTAPVTWQANYGNIKWSVGGSYSSGRAYSDPKFVSPVVGDGNNLYLAVQREIPIGPIGTSVNWGIAPATSAFNPSFSVSGSASQFTGIAVGDYVRKASQGISQYHLVVSVFDGTAAQSASGYIATSSATGLLLQDSVAVSVEQLVFFRSNYLGSADLITDALGPIYDSDYMWIGRRVGQYFILRDFGTLAPGQEIQILSGISLDSTASSGSSDMSLVFGNATTFSSAGSLSANGGNQVLQIVKQRKGNLVSPTGNNSLGELTFTLPATTSLSIPAGSSLWASLPDSAPITCSSSVFTASAQYVADLVGNTPVVLTSQVGFATADIAVPNTTYYVWNIVGNTFNLYTSTGGSGTLVDASATSALGGLGFIYSASSLTYNSLIPPPSHDTSNTMVPRGQLYILTAAQTATEEFDLRNLYLIASRVEGLSNSLTTATVPGLLFFDGTSLTTDGQFIENGFAVHGATSVFGGLKDSYVTSPVFLGDGDAYGSVAGFPVNNTVINPALMAPDKAVESILGGLNAVIASQSDETNTGFVAWSTGSSAPYYSVGSGLLTVLHAGIGRIKGQEVAWAGGQSVSVPANGAFGLVYVNAVGTVLLTTSIIDTTYQNNIPLFEVFVDSTGVVLVTKENHPYSFNTAASRYLHNNAGTVIRGLGADIAQVTVGTGLVATDRELQIALSDYLDDHGLTTVIPVSNPVVWNFMYTDTAVSGSLWTRDGIATAVFSPKYNNAGVLTALNTSGSGSVGVFTLYVAKDDMGGTPLFFAVYDTSSYPDLVTAQAAIDAGTTAHIGGSLGYLESAQLGYVLFQNNVNGGFINSALVDKSTFNSKLVGGGNQGYAGLVSTITTNFNGMLSGADVTVQGALETIDDYVFDNNFKVENVSDHTKEMKLDVEDVTTGTISRGRVPVPGIVSAGTGDFILGTTTKPVSGSYQALQGDRVLLTGLSASAPTDITLPAVPANGSIVQIKDAGRTSSQYPVTINVLSPDTLELGAGDYVLCEDGASLTLQYSAGNWSVQAPISVSPSASQLAATASPSWDSVDLPFEAIATSVSTVNTVTPLDLSSTKGRALELLPADYVQGMVYRTTTPIAGLSSLSLQVGDSAVVDKFFTSTNVMSSNGGVNSQVPVLESMVAANQMVATLTGNVALNNMSAGVVQLQVLKSNLIGAQGARNQPSWKKFVINYKDVAAIGAVISGQCTIPVKFSGYCVSGVAIRTTRPFIGITSPLVSLNLGGIAEISGFSPTVAGSFQSANVFQVVGPRTPMSAFLSWSATTSLSGATDGELEVYLQVSQYEVPTDKIWNLGSVIKQVSDTPAWQKFSVGYSSLSSLIANTPQTLNICPVYGDEIVHSIFFKTRSQFVGPANIRASIGDGVLVPEGSAAVVGSGTATYLANFNVDTSVTETNFPTPYSSILYNLFDSSSRMLQVSFTAGASGSLSAGLLDIYVLKSKLASK